MLPILEDNPKNASSDYCLNIATSLWTNKHSALCAPAFPGYNRHERSDCRSGLRTTRGQRPIVGMARQEHREQVRLGARTRQRHRIAIIGTLHFEDNRVDRPEDGEVEVAFSTASGPTVTIMGSSTSTGTCLSLSA